MHVHACGGGEVLNSYHYVAGNVLQVYDPLGLASGEWTDAGVDATGRPLEARDNPNPGPGVNDMDFRFAADPASGPTQLGDAEFEARIAPLEPGEASVLRDARAAYEQTGHYRQDADLDAIARSTPSGPGHIPLGALAGTEIAVIGEACSLFPATCAFVGAALSTSEDEFAETAVLVGAPIAAEAGAALAGRVGTPATRAPVRELETEAASARPRGGCPNEPGARIVTGHQAGQGSPGYSIRKPERSVLFPARTLPPYPRVGWRAAVATGT